MEISIYLKYYAKFGTTLKVIASKPSTLIAVTPLVAMPIMTTTHKALILLGGLFVVDFITGIWASYTEEKEKLEIKPKGFMQKLAHLLNVVSSSKLRLSAVKFVTYSIAALTAKAVEWAFINGDFEPHEKLQRMSLTTIVVAFLCGIEAYSILIENAKRLGFDLIKKIKTISSKGWSLYKSIKNESDGTTE